MATEILIYSPIFNFTAEFFIREMEEKKDEDIVVRLHTIGGDVLAAWGIIAKAKEHPNRFSIKVDGQAASMGAYLLLFFDDVEALDFSRFNLHRASLTNEESRDQETLDILAEINKQLRSAMEAKLNIPRFEKLAGVTLDEFFKSKEVIDVNFNAKKAKSIGLIKKITNLAPEQIQALGDKFAAFQNQPVKDPPNPKNTKQMTLEEFKADHPELYSACFQKGVTAGKDTGAVDEKDRVQAWMAFNDVDPKAVADGIESGDNLSQKATAEFSRKALSAEAMAKLKEGNAPNAPTEQSPELTAATEALKTAEESGDAKAIATAKVKVDEITALNSDEGDKENKELVSFEAKVKENMSIK